MDSKVPRCQGKEKKLDKHYPFNCISKYYPLANSQPHDIQSKFMLPCGFMYGETWGALKKSWRGYKRAKSDNDRELMYAYAKQIQKLETELGVPTASFPNLGLIGDIFFLYDKVKENELRQKYAAEKVVCDKFGSQSIEELVDQGKAIVFENSRALKEYQREKSWKESFKVLDEWAMSEKSQEFFAVARKRWWTRNEIKAELNEIKKELRYYNEHYAKKVNPNTTKELRKKLARRRKALMYKKVLKEAELSSIHAVELVKTDNGWKYAKRILMDNLRHTIVYDQVPHYYLTDHRGRRLGNYKEEMDMGYDKDPYFYKLYLEDKEWQLQQQEEMNQY